ncbi:MAG: nicotinate-nucleotide--dimethylbenzimidazole phosphoribosyltransferase [Planktomarina sp.]
MTLTSMDQIRALFNDLPAANADALAAAQDRNMQLTKPPAALGRLEDLAVWAGSWQGTDKPSMNNAQAVVFAGNHGVAAAGVSAFPPEVTVQMVANFAHGGAAINQLCKANGATLDVHAIDLDRPTADFRDGPAMSEDDFVAAWNLGWDSVNADADVFLTGEMGIGNTTPAAAVSAALFGGSAEDWVGRGTGVDDTGLKLKQDVVTAGLTKHADAIDALDTLRRLGGRELVAMAAAILSARAKSIPVLMDGFICTAAAATLHVQQSGALDHVVAAHQSAEGAHAQLLKHLTKEPILSLGLRLGEGSGAALALGVLKGAIACHSGMATFAEAGVSAG